MFIRPWNKEAERILIQLEKNGKAFTHNSNIGREFGKKHKNIFNNGFLDVASTRYSKRRDKTLFQTPDDIKIFRKGSKYYFKRLKML